MVRQENANPAIGKSQKIVLFIFYIGLPFFYSSNGVDPSLIPRQIAACILVGVLSCALFWQQRKEMVTITILPAAMALLWVVYSTSSLQAINKTESWYIILKIGLFVCLYWVMYALAKRHILTVKLLSLIVSIAGMISTLMAIGDMLILQSKGISLFEGENMYRVNTTFGHKNLLASFLFLCLPMFVVQFVLSRKILWKSILVILGALLTGVLLVLQTRAVLLALLVCMAVAVFILMAGFARQLSVWQKRSAIICIAGGLLILSAFIFISRDRLTLLTRTESFKERKNLWDNTWQMISEHPVEGVGAANWQIQMPKYGMQKFHEVNYTISEGLTNFQRPHNDFLWVWAETGIVGFLLYVFIFVISLVYAYRLLKREEVLAVKIGYAMMFLQIVGFMVISSVDFPLERIEHPAIILASVGILAAKHGELQKWKGIQLKSWIWLFPVVLSMFSIYVCVQRWQGELQLRKMYRAHASGNWQRLIIESNKINASCFNMDYYSIPVKWYAGVGYFMQDNLTSAKQSFEEAYQLHPYQVHVLNNYGACFEKEGNHTKAIELLEESHRLSPTFSDGIINLSGAYFNAGRYDDAYTTIMKFRYDEQNERFKTFALAIIKVKLEDVIVKEKKSMYATYLKKIASDDKAILQAYYEAQVNGLSLTEQLKQQSFQVNLNSY